MKNIVVKETLISIVTDAFKAVKYNFDKKFPKLKNDDLKYGSPKFITPRGSFFRHVDLDENIDFMSI